jgi:Xaa-Pro aminopeptidase
LIKDLDVEMEKRNVDSIIVFGDSTVGNPDLRYVAGTSLPRGGIFLKRISHDPTLIVSNIDIGSARQGSVRNIKDRSDYGFDRISSKYNRDEARIRFYEKIMKDEGLRGPTILAGRNDVSNTLHLIDALRRRGAKITGERSPTIIEAARETKDGWEVERLRLLGRKTTRVVEETLRFLRGAKVAGKKISYKSKPLTVGTVKKVIGRSLSEQNLVAPEDTIFAPGKGGSDPHYRGEDADIIRGGEPIVFDIFPSEPDGYWHDCTRTYLFGSAPKKVKEMYDAVLEVQKSSLDMVREQVLCKDMMTNACKIFERKGYPTARQLVKGNKEARVRGFMHGLGHGVGLTIGERPYLTLYGIDHLRKGSVVTIEPGLYEPRWGGVRIEDTVVVGSPSENLTPLSKDIEL